MDQPSSSRPLPSLLTTKNPIAALGRKVKSVLSTNQRPSVRIRRDHSSNVEQRRRGPVSESNPEKYVPRWSLFGRKDQSAEKESFEDEYDADAVDLLDVVDPEVATLATLTNVQNSLFVPSLGRILNRRPTYRLRDSHGEAGLIDKLISSLKHMSNPVEEGDDRGSESKFERSKEQQATTRAFKSPLSTSEYAILPYGETLEGWTDGDKEELDDLVRHKLHSRRERYKRSMKGFLQYVRRPLGLFITVYATLITLFGAAWVLFLIGWISLGSKRDYVVNIVDNVLVALFAIIGDGLAPFRAVDTFHMIYIAYYHRKTWRRREKLGLPELVDHNDLPDQRKEDVEPAEVDLEGLIARKIPRGLARRIAARVPKKLAQRIITRNKTDDTSHAYTVLSKEEQEKLEYHERKFSKSHTFYKPHETETHYAFPLKLLVTVVILLDFHSALQISLGACTWGIPYKHRPFALTTVILCCSITCNITAGILISVGDKKTRKKDVIERMIQQELTAEAIEQMRMQRIKEAEERGEIDKSVRKKLEEEKEEAENEEIKKSWKAVPSLPKKLLGKGEDHRQPPLPQKARRSNENVASTSTINPKSVSSMALPHIREDPAQLSRPEPASKRSDKGHWTMSSAKRSKYWPSWKV